MTLPQFKNFVSENSEWFEGVAPEDAGTIAAAEASLGCRLPPTMTWLLTKVGYSFSAGVDSLADSVEATLRCRKSMFLPNRYVILNDWNDAGVVFFDTETRDSEGEYVIAWTGCYNFGQIANGEAIDEDADIFERYSAWVEGRLLSAKEEAAEG
ncbi:MAG: SMI1/KNR4 family protein [Roseibacillus sp.]